MVTYKYKNKIYEIIVKDEGEYNLQRKNQILSDFLFCEKIGEWNTINNRVTNGIKWGWLKEIK
jgi:hypothetical protein